MKPLVLYYPKCTTCKKALKWLDDNGIAYEGRHIVEANPSEEELRQWHRESGLPLKDKLPTMSEDEQYALLATDGMLVKRPLLIADGVICPGFKEAEWEKLK